MFCELVVNRSCGRRREGSSRSDPCTKRRMTNASRLVAPTRVVRDYLSSSLVWKDFLEQGGFVPTDIVVADPFKAGTTWTQRIVQQILDNGEEPASGLSDTSPWLDSSWGDHPRMLAVLRGQRERGQRRVIKSHLPADAVPIDAEARYVFVGRNGKDIGISFHNYLKHFSAETMADIDRIHAEWSGDKTPLVIPDGMREFFDVWLDTGGYGCCDLFDVVKSWWKVANRPNVLLVHYDPLKQDLPGQIERIATFIGADPKRLRMPEIVEHASFGFMRSRAERLVPFGGAHMNEPKAFFHKGPARDYRTELTPEQIERFDRKALEQLGPDCARWLETGK
jgi:aryl sulfotransferase